MAKEKRMISKEKLKERRLGYLLIAPSLLLILAIAIWPVIQSFYFSLFDYRLNDPTKSAVHTSYSLDLDKYLNNYPFLVSSLEKEINAADNESVKNTISDLQDKLTSIDTEIKSDEGTATQYEQVNELLDEFKNPSEALKYVTIDKETAEALQNTLNEFQNTVASVTKTETLLQPDKLVGLANGMSESIVKPNYIGFSHYEKNLTSGRMWSAIGNTATFTVISVTLELILGLAIALLINKAFIGRGLIRATILIPWAIPTAVSALMWKFLYDGQNGIVAKYFADIGLVEKMSYLLTTEVGAMFSVIFSDVWKTTPYMALLLLAGLQTIPDSLYEASSIDGATKWEQFTNVTLPLLKSSILVALLFRTLDAFRVFDLIFVLTGGGPANSTETISILAYKVMFSQTNFGEGSALSVIVFICVAIISIIYIRILGSDLISDGSSK